MEPPDTLKAMLDRIRARRAGRGAGRVGSPAAATTTEASQDSPAPALPAESAEVVQFVDPDRPGRRGDKLNLILLRLKEARLAATPETGTDIRSRSEIPLAERVEQFEAENPALARFGQRITRGFKSRQQGFTASGLDTRARTLTQLEAIERGEDVPTFALPHDPVERGSALQNIAGWRKWSPERRQKMIERLRKEVAGDVATVARLQQEIEAIPQNPAAEAVMSADTFEEGFEALRTDPLGVIAQLGVESMVSSAPSLIAGTVGAAVAGPPGAALGTGLGSGTVETQAALLEGLGRLGIDISDPDQIQSALSDPETSRTVRSYARSRATIIGTLDAASGGLASRTLAPKAVQSQLVRQAINIPVQTATQAALGAGGEALAQLETTGEIRPGEVLAEGIGELFGAPVEALSLGQAARGDRLGQKLAALRPRQAQQSTQPEPGSATAQTETGGVVSETTPESRGEQPQGEQPATAEVESESPAGVASDAPLVEPTRAQAEASPEAAIPAADAADHEILFTAKDGNTQVRRSEERGLFFADAKTGKTLNQRNRAFEPALAEFMADRIDLFDQGRRVTDLDPAHSMDQFPQAVAARSENPFEVVEAYRLAQEQATLQNATIDPVTEAFEEALQQSRIATASFDRFGDPARRLDDRQITLNYLGGDTHLDTLAGQITTKTGIETTPNDLVELMERFPGGPRTFSGQRPAVLGELAERFEHLTGVRLTDSLAERIVAEAFVPSEGVESSTASIQDEFLFAGRPGSQPSRRSPATGSPAAGVSAIRQEIENRVGRLRAEETAASLQGEPSEQARAARAEAEGVRTNPTVGEMHRSTTATSATARQALPDFIREKAETPEGRKLLDRLRKDTKGERVGMRSIVGFLNDQIGIELRIGVENTTRRHPAVFERARTLARSRSGVATHNFHEAGHGISALMELNSPALLQHPGLNALTFADGSLASAHTPEEGFAEWVRLFVMNPGLTASLGVTAPIVSQLEQHSPRTLRALRDTARAVDAHLSRAPEAQFRSMNRDRPEQPRWTEQLRNAVDRVLFTAGSRSWAIERTERAIWRAFREAIDDRKEADRLARRFFAGVRDTSADLRQAYQAILRISSEVAMAMIGTKRVAGLRALTTGEGVQLSGNEVLALENAGITVPAGLVNPRSKHGTMVPLTDFSLQSVVEAVGADNWSDFETYAQARVSLERFRQKGLMYPGWETVPAAEMERIIAMYEADHPSWTQQFDRLQQYTNQLLVLSVAGGMLSVESAVAMRQAWESYIPLLRVSEREGAGGVSQATRVDPGFRRAKGSELPIMPLLEALEQRTRQVLDAYYTNRAMLAPVHMAEHAQRSSDLPFELRTMVGRVVSPLKGIRIPAAKLSKEEAKVVIAEFLNQEKARAKGAGLTPEEQAAVVLEDSEKVQPSDIALSWSGMDLWRGADPKGINIIAPKVQGEHAFYQVEDPILFDLFAKSSEVGPVLDFFFNKVLARVVEPWKRALTQNLVFAIRNSMARDPATASFYGLPPELSSKIDAKQAAKTLLPGYFLVAGLVQKLTGRVPSGAVQGELLSRTFQTTTSVAHKARVSRFREVFEEGVVIDGYFQMPLVERLAALPGQVMSALLKPVDIFLWGTGQRAFAQLTEEATRLGAYAAVKKAGLSDEAGQRAYDLVSGNFGERPASGGVSAVYRSAGFLNPATQVAVEMYRRVTSPDPEVGWRAVAARLASTALFTAIGWAVNKLLTSDEREEELKERPDWDRLNYMPIGGYIRLPFDYGPVGAVQAFTWNLLDTAAGDGPRAKSMARIVLQRAFDLPGHPTAFVNPQLLTILENEANYSFFYGEPIEPPYFEFLPPEQRAFYSTPGFYRWLGEMSGQSPVKINNFVRNALSSQLDEGIKLIDQVNTGRPRQDLSDIPLFGKLIQRTPRGWFTRSVEEVVELDEKYRAVKRLYERAIEDRDATQQTREELARRMNALSMAHQAMLALQSQQDQIRLARDAGRFDLIEELQQTMQEIAARALADSGLFPADQEPVPNP